LAEFPERADVSVPQPVHGKGKGRELPSPALNSESVSTPAPSRRSKKHASSPILVPSDVHPDATPEPKPPPHKRRKTDLVDPNRVLSPSSPLAPPSHPLRSQPSTSRLRQSRAAEPEPPPREEPPTPTQLRRVKLIVRRPPPTFTNPRHKAAPPAFGKSLTALLSSYHTLDGREADKATLAEAARKDAKFLEHVYALRQQGRLLLPTDQVLSSDPWLAQGEPKRGVDVWDHVLEDVRLRARLRASESAAARTTAAIVKGVKTYWENYAAKEDRAKVVEVKRLKALAKATMKLVINEWKKAVFHIREQERLRREAEEKQRGREHLDAILDQSGQILETQQLDLSKGGRT
ncbi:hypothetical protein DENSPDRAFT_855714, partial [Dentipellis sp. KUC8613]